MSLIISFTPPTPDQTREARQKRAVRQRTLLVAGTMALIGAMAALPLPVWKASAQLGERASTLRGWIEDARTEESAAHTFRALGKEAEAHHLDGEVAALLAPHDRLATTRLLLSMARSTGLAVARTDMRPDAELLFVETSERQGSAVLGMAAPAAPDLTPRVTGTPLPLHADRFMLEGHGQASSLLLFCGVLAAMPAPLRLRSLHWKAEGADLHFVITIEKLVLGALASPADAGASTEVPDGA